MSNDRPFSEDALSSELHESDPEAFRRHVRSFDFWLESVEGYLEGTQHGHLPGTPDPPLDADQRERLVTVLCHYCVGETAALEGAGALIEIAPSREAKIFLATQTVDEGRHLEVLTHRLRELGVADPEAEIERRATRELLDFRRRLLELVHARDWDAALFAQNVVLEAMEFAVFHRHARTADPRTRELLEGIVKDERRHIGFGENELGRRLRQNPALRPRLRRLRTELDGRVMESFARTLDVVGEDAGTREGLARSYLDAVERLGFD